LFHRPLLRLMLLNYFSEAVEDGLQPFG